MIFASISSEVLLLSVILISTSLVSGSYLKDESLNSMDYEPEIKESLTNGQIKAMYNLLFSYLENAENSEELEKKSIYLPRIGSEKRASIFLPRIGTQRRSFHMPRVGRSSGSESYFPEKQVEKKSFHMPRVGK